MRKLIIPLLLMTLVACGKKGDPLPKATLGIPAPDWAELTLEDEGVRIVNNNGEYGLLVERTTYDVGDLQLPFYDRMAELEPGESYIDNSTQENIRYNYRLRAIHSRYRAYGEPIVHPVSYISRVAVEDVRTQIYGGELCLTYRLSENTARSDIMVNGVHGTALANGCYKLPRVANILLVIVPYSEAGTPGQAYRTNLEQDLSGLLLPPQNIRIIRSAGQIILSWTPSKGAVRYRITSDLGSAITDSNLYNHPLGKGCTNFLIHSIDSIGQESEAVEVESCP